MCLLPWLPGLPWANLSFTQLIMSPRKVKSEVPRLPAHDIYDEENRLKKVGGYIIGKSIGEGSFAKVKEGIHILTNMRVWNFFKALFVINSGIEYSDKMLFIMFVIILT